MPITLEPFKEEQEKNAFKGNFISNEEINEIMLEAQDMAVEVEEEEDQEEKEKK